MTTTTTMQGMSAIDMATLFLGAASASAALMPPNVGLALTLANGVLGAVKQAQANGTDITDEELAKLFDLDTAARLADKVEQQRQQVIPGAAP